MAPARFHKRLNRFLAVICVSVFGALAFGAQPASATLGSISGNTFDDLNDNGILEAGEVAHGSLTVWIDSNSNGTYDIGEPTTVTDGSGAYSFTNIADGSYDLRVVVPNSTYGATNTPLTVTVASAANVLGANLGVSTFGAVAGTVFNDNNGNGNLNSGDLGASGKQVYVDNNASGTYNNGEPTTTTDSSGNFRIAGLSASSTANVRLVVPPGSQLTSPLPTSATITAGGTTSGISFALFTQNTIGGTVYNDVNGNGVKDSGDTGITTKVVYLDTNNNDAKDAGELTATTNTSGVYSITGVGPGTFPVRLVDSGTTQQTSTDPSDVVSVSGMAWTGDDFGIFTLGGISGTIYNDLNASGTKDSSETAGLVGKTVFLDTDNDGTLDSGEPNVQTNSNGLYTFTGLGPGTYRVRAVTTANTTQTSTNPAAITMTSAAINGNTNIGYFLGTTLSGLVYDDTGGNGVLNAGESGIAGITVYDDANSNGAVDSGEMSDTTDTTGHYSFANLTPGSFRIRIVVPTNYMQTSAQPTLVTPSSGSTTTTNVGIFRYATIGGTVFNDVSGDGFKDTGDNGVSGITIYLDANNNSIFDLGEASTTTNSSGAWSVTGLGPASYKPRPVTPTATTITTGPAAAITATSGLTNNSTNFGFFTAATISGSVYNDFDGDGVRELGEAGLSGKSVFLDTNNDGLLSTGEVTVTTDTSGNYTFTGLGAGNFRPRLNLASGGYLTSTNVDYITATSGLATTGVNFAVFTTATISGTIYNDVNGDGTKQAGDTGLTTRVAYLDTNNNGIKDTGETSITTATAGTYSFTGLLPGTYRVRVVVPNTSQQTSSNPAAVTTTSGSLSSANDFGLFQYGTIGGTVYNDVNGSGTKTTGENGVAGRTLYLDANSNDTLDSGEVSVLTNSTGVYTFTGLTAGSYRVRLATASGSSQTTNNPNDLVVISASSNTTTDFGVFMLASLSGTVYNDINGNGVANAPGDTGLAGMTVFLDTNSNGSPDTGEATTTTDSSGNYGFTNLPANTYRPRVVVPATHTLTTATLPLVTTASGTASTGNDLGLFINGIVNGSVFSDSNGNGVKDLGEPGVSAVRIYSDTNGNNTYTASEPTVLTDSNGDYSLTGLKVGTGYKIRVVPVTGATTSSATPAAITVTSGTVVNGTDFGMFLPGSISGTVFNDVNSNATRDSGEALLAAKTVFLDANNDGIKQTTETSVNTSTSGAFSFTALNSGTYYVRIVVPTGNTLTTTLPPALIMTSGLASTTTEFGLHTTTTTTTTTPPVTTPTTQPPVVVPPPAPSNDAASANTGYWMTSADGGVYSYGAAPFLGSAAPFHPTAPVVGLAPTVSNQGYYQVATDGGIFAFGDAKFYGSMGGRVLNKPMVGMAVTPTGAGYWTVATDGGVFSYGDAKFYGSTGAIKLNQPIVAIQPTSTGKGYWLVATDGGIFAYGDAKFYGSTGSIKLNKPIVGMARATGDAGYWMVASDGGIFAFGTAPFYGSMGSKALNQPIVSMHAPASGDGYWFFARDGGVFAYGSSKYYGGTPGTGSPIVQ